MDGWLAYAGKYAYVHIPDISWRAWHPFSIAHVYSTGEGDAAKHFAVFLIKAASVSRGGKKNFTNALYSLAAGGLADDMLSSADDTQSSARRSYLAGAQVYLDGPFHGPVSAAMDKKAITSLAKFHSRDVVLVAGGIGITPMLPLIESLVESPPKGLRRVRLVWVCNCPEPFAAWFAERLLKLQRHANATLEQKVSTSAAAGSQLVKVELRLYSTGECTTVKHVIIIAYYDRNRNRCVPYP